MLHYTCPACQGVAESPGACETEGCALQGTQLKECTCDDLQHKEATETE